MAAIGGPNIPTFEGAYSHSASLEGMHATATLPTGQYRFIHYQLHQAPRSEWDSDDEAEQGAAAEGARDAFALAWRIDDSRVKWIFFTRSYTIALNPDPDARAQRTYLLAKERKINHYSFDPTGLNIVVREWLSLDHLDHPNPVCNPLVGAIIYNQERTGIYSAIDLNIPLNPNA